MHTPARPLRRPSLLRSAGDAFHVRPSSMRETAWAQPPPVRLAPLAHGARARGRPTAAGDTGGAAAAPSSGRGKPHHLRSDGREETWLPRTGNLKPHPFSGGRRELSAGAGARLRNTVGGHGDSTWLAGEAGRRQAAHLEEWTDVPNIRTWSGDARVPGAGAPGCRPAPSRCVYVTLALGQVHGEMAALAPSLLSPVSQDGWQPSLPS